MTAGARLPRGKQQNIGRNLAWIGLGDSSHFTGILLTMREREFGDSRHGWLLALAACRFPCRYYGVRPRHAKIQEPNELVSGPLLSRLENVIVRPSFAHLVRDT